jgi:hypothetical protein
VLLITIYLSYVIEETEDQSVLNNGNIGLIADLINYFMLFEFSRHCERLKIQELWMGEPANALEVFNLIFRWLNFKKFSHTTVSINKKYSEPVPALEKEKEKGE